MKVTTYNRLYSIIFFTVIWCGFSNDFSGLNILLGAIVSTACTWMLITKEPQLHRPIHPGYLLLLISYIVYQLIRSSLLVAWDILTPTDRNQPNIISVNLASDSPLIWTVVGNLVSLTPGTLCIDINSQGEMLVHDMFSQHAQQTTEFIQQKLEPLVQKAFGQR